MIKPGVYAVIIVLVFAALLKSTESCSRGSKPSKPPTTPKPGKPSFSTLKNNYPSTRRYPNIAQTAGLGTYLYGVNSCAMRVSYALYKSGHTINIGYNECDWSEEKNNRGQKYIIRVDTMRCYLTSRWGSPLSTTSRSQLLGKKGVIAFKECTFPSGARGHVDVWNGSRCSGKCYWNLCTKYYLWKL